MKLILYTEVRDYLGGKSHAVKVVLNLMEANLNTGHSLYMDNYYNSMDLSKKLLQYGTHSTETLRLNRKNNTSEVTHAKLNTGESVRRYSNGVCIGKMRDKRDVVYIAPDHENEDVQTTNKRGQHKLKPKPIAEYNK